ncbi:uncharacterized membrane protein YgdD (TMEM256/DUF423 family) [Gelidibacter algens]|jgi:uncharacterized membrane protein YgdD (TMEM256/DUF423 family)|uniref:Uncharacterized membrane protein YgdD (TMEM256/DUF423 family) n=1 Tax=Gelidibacter algens TaxID=49280 RepID=A0A1A7QXL7_9FLAO|nr:DUF423 domain-containing protein [Gelidibacter algens]OBX24755.1 hypothetical protein A9996_13755 [Gelidibacter algens]RAJ19268.1 uncharacterized membrane protein YgdD (TMEM256/DUF423 family) [Gelidibacter algens]
MNRIILTTAAIFGIIAIALGAFGAHGLKQLISVDAQLTFETGVRYQMYHALLLLFVGTTSLIKEKLKAIIYYLVVFGVFLFSGSIYGLATMAVTNIDFKSVGFITPIGGLLLIISWVVMLINFLKMRRDNS